MKKEFDICKRSLIFSVEVIKYFQKKSCCNFIEQIVIKQLIRAVTSIGANLHESKGAHSTKDYKNFFSIALKSSNESKYWFEILKQTSKMDEMEKMLCECEEISNIIASCIIKMKK